jgi:hypothetical protein
MKSFAEVGNAQRGQSRGADQFEKGTKRSRPSECPARHNAHASREYQRDNGACERRIHRSLGHLSAVTMTMPLALYRVKRRTADRQNAIMMRCSQ